VFVTAYVGVWAEANPTLATRQARQAYRLKRDMVLKPPVGAAPTPTLFPSPALGRNQDEKSAAKWQLRFPFPELKLNGVMSNLNGSNRRVK
jgi:hypothetical protein